LQNARRYSNNALFDPDSRPSLVPAKSCSTVQPHGCPEPVGRVTAGQTSGRRIGCPIGTATRSLALTRLMRATAIIAGIILWFSLSAVFTDAKIWAGQPSFGAHRQTLPAVSSFARFVTEAAQRFDMPERWIHAVMRVESDGDQRSRSPKGAMGLMQIMPRTWRDLRARYGLGTNPYDPRDNILAGAAYLREMHNRYGVPGFLAAYNAGPGRYERHLATGWPLPVETRAYVTKLVPLIDGGQIRRGAMANAFAQIQPRATVFVPRPERRLRGDRAASSKRSSGSSRARATIDPSALAPCPQKLFVRHVDEDPSR
jgi:SLT domain-containing protein